MNLISTKRIGALLAGALITLAGCSDSGGTTATTLPGTITGTVRKGTAPVTGVVVTPDPASGPAVVTGLDGTYRLTVLPGSYRLTFAGDNLEPCTEEATVGAGETVTVDTTMVDSTLRVTVTVPAAYRFGGPTGFGTTVSGITASATLNGEPVASPNVTWTIKDYYGLANPPAAATPEPATGTTTSFTVADFASVLAGANASMNARYGTLGTDDEFDYIETPPRYGLVSFGTEQVRAMSYKVIATVRVGSRTSTGSAVVSPVTISNGGNTQPLGMMVVGNAPEGDAATYAWTLEYLPATALAGTPWGAPPEGVVLQGADTKNPTVVPTVAGVYRLTEGTGSVLFRVSTYHGAGTADTDAGADGVACASCHEGEYALTSKFAEWGSSAHANFNWKDPLASPAGLFQFGLTGGEGTGYRESCISCHVVGYSKVPTAQNRGWDDEAAEAGWTFPNPPAPAAWDTVVAQPALLHRANIQCENCHGPLEPADHSSVGFNANGEALAINYGTVAPTASMDAGVCLVCHDALTHHDRGSLWSASGHANLELAIEEGAGSTNCARCHSAEGFMKYLPLQQAGTPGSLPNLDGLSVDTVHSQTCQTCHDPHSTELRVSGDTRQVAAMFAVPNAGAGALCIICHNSRSGAVRQGTATLSSLSRLGPHAACQGDMFAGRNAFFVPNLGAGDAPTTLPNLSAHAFLADTCADCHVKWVPEDIKTKYQVWNTNHTFRTSTAVCAECHADNIGERIQESISTKMEILNARVTAILSAKLLQNAGFATAAGSRKTPGDLEGPSLPDPASLTVLPADVQGISADPDNGAVIVALKDGSRFEVTLDKINAAGTTTALFSAADANTQTVAKAYFNLLYVSRDGAKGVHNPQFAAQVLDRATAALVGVSIP